LKRAKAPAKPTKTHISLTKKGSNIAAKAFCNIALLLRAPAAYLVDGPAGPPFAVNPLTFSATGSVCVALNGDEIICFGFLDQPNVSYPAFGPEIYSKNIPGLYFYTFYSPPLVDSSAFREPCWAPSCFGIRAGLLAMNVEVV
jgi:hypothetical protein